MTATRGIVSAFPRSAIAVRDRRWLAPAVMVLAVLVTALVPLLFNRRYYFIDDTQTYYFGMWSRMGDRLLSGHWGFLDPSGWMTGNYALDSQYGNWSPILLAISVFASLSSNLLVFSIVLKLVLLSAGAVGFYVLARTFGVTRPWSAVVGMLVPFNGTTFYIDSPSWDILLLVWAVFPFFWAALRVIPRRGPLWAILAAYLLVSLGFVQGVIAGGIAILAVLIELFVQRRLRDLPGLILAGVAAVLTAVMVFLPSALSASVTWRGSSGVHNDTMMVGTFDELVTSHVLAANPPVSSFWGENAPMPVGYIAWLLPILAFVPWRELKDRLKGVDWPSLVLFLGLALLVMMGPSNIGPVRAPVRLYAEFASIVLVLLGVLLTAGGLRFTRSRLLVALGVTAAGAVLAFGQDPNDWKWLAVGAVLAGLGLALLWWLGRRRASDPSLLQLSAVVIVAVFGVLAVGIQHRAIPTTGMEDFQLPTDRASYEAVGPQFVDDVLVVGSPRKVEDRPAIWTESLLGNSWYLNPAHVQNLYTPIGHQGYSEALCMDYIGQTCPELLTRLFQDQPETGIPLADQLSVNTLLIVKPADLDRTAVDVPVGDDGVPEGWSKVDEGAHTVTWVRDTPVARAGGVVAASDGTTVRETSVTETTVTLSVDEVPSSGGTVYLSRIAWPGYSASGGSSVSVTDGYLLGVDLPASAAGSTVTVSFSPPAWPLVIVSAILLVLLAAGAQILFAVRRRRAPSPERNPHGVSESPASVDRVRVPHP